MTHSEQPNDEIESAYQDLTDDLQSLVREYRSTARIFPEDTDAQRAVAFCADKLEDTVEEHSLAGGSS